MMKQISRQKLEKLSPSHPFRVPSVGTFSHAMRTLKSNQDFVDLLTTRLHRFRTSDGNPTRGLCVKLFFVGWGNYASSAGVLAG